MPAQSIPISPRAEALPPDYMQVALATLVPGREFAVRLFIDEGNKSGRSWSLGLRGLRARSFVSGASTGSSGAARLGETAIVHSVHSIGVFLQVQRFAKDMPGPRPASAGAEPFGVCVSAQPGV